MTTSARQSFDVRQDLPAPSDDFIAHPTQDRSRLKALLQHFAYVAEVWDWSSECAFGSKVRVRSARKHIFMTEPRAELEEQLKELLPVRDVYLSKLRSADVDGATPNTELIAQTLRQVEVNVDLLRAIIDAIDSLPINGQTIDGKIPEIEQQEMQRLFSPQNNEVTLEQLGLPTVPERLAALQEQLTDAEERRPSNERCRKCKWFRCKCRKEKEVELTEQEAAERSVTSVVNQPRANCCRTPSERPCLPENSNTKLALKRKFIYQGQQRGRRYALKVDHQHNRFDVGLSSPKA